MFHFFFCSEQTNIVHPEHDMSSSFLSSFYLIKPKKSNKEPKNRKCPASVSKVCKTEKYDATVDRLGVFNNNSKQIIINYNK